ncbi:dnaJ subfamily C member 11-like protein [Leptotrombidium deliense]|uniref:DnaJ subfamily C member 11-like protein n=1 Tax=Leptotrombidium deliense TaxID=299467 RepID=A0A443S4V2_9ACAR|nr:dnaJ subfamily C member 11-like protein [Leptotrombidium deliense]
MDISAETELEDDYYAFLNVAKNNLKLSKLQATEEQIIASYRRLSRLFHPDKHQNENAKKEAEILFNKAKKAYEGS